jgi:hypothetical protein
MKLSAHQTLPPMPDLSPFADEDALITQLLLAMLRQVTERAADGSAAVFLEPLHRYETTYLNTAGAAADLCPALLGTSSRRTINDVCGATDG